MTPKRYWELKPVADCLAGVCAGGRALSNFSRRAPRGAIADVKRLSKWWSPNIAGFGFGPKNGVGRYCVRFYVYRRVHESRVRPTELIPKKLAFDHLDIELRTDVHELDALPVLQGPLSAGSEVGHFTGSVGTTGCYVRRSGSMEPLLLSCSHVLAPFRANINDVVESPVDNNSQSSNNPVGKVAIGSILLRPGSTHITDAALAVLTGSTAPSNTALGIGRLTSLQTTPRALTGTTIELRGAATKTRVTGVVSSDSLVTMKFQLQGQAYQVQNLLRYEVSTKEGDSGSAVVEMGKGRVLGLHVGAEHGTTHGFFAPSWIIAAALRVELLT